MSTMSDSSSKINIYYTKNIDTVVLDAAKPLEPKTKPKPLKPET